VSSDVAENVEIVRRIYEIGERVQDVGATLDESVREGLLAPDAEWRGGRGIAGIQDAVGRDKYVAMDAQT
jgi:hypothetical protein